MKRLVITAPRKAEFEDVEPPRCPEKGVLVRARLTAISTGTELRVYRGIPVDEAGKFLHERIPFELPAENGYSMVGEVVETGADVNDVTVGQRVFATAGHRQVAAVLREQIMPLPESIDDEEAAFFNVLEVSHRAIRQANVRPGENVAIVGQGVIGLAALAYCRAFGFRTAAIDVAADRLRIAEQMGAMLAISPGEKDFLGKATDFFHGEGADAVLESASRWSAIRTAMEIARVDGKIVVVSRHTKPPDFNPVGHPFLGKRLNLMTSYGYPPDGQRWDADHSRKLTLELLAQRRLLLGPMITHRFGWEEIPQVYRRLDEGDISIVGALIQW